MGGKQGIVDGGRRWSALGMADGCLIGWLISGLAVALGAPFWFDLLNKLVNLRGTGPRPAPAAK